MGVKIFADAEFKQTIFNHGFRLGHSDPPAEIMNGFRRNASAAQGAQSGHSRVIPPFHISFLHKLDKLAFGKHRIGKVETGKFSLLGMVDVQRLQHPVVQLPVVHELQGTERMRDTLYGVAQGMREIVHRIDAPLVTGAVMRGMAYPVQGGITHDQIGRRHVDLRAQHVRAIRKLASAHTPEEIEVLLDRTVSIGTLPARLSQCPPVLTNLIGGKVIHIGLSHFDELLGVLVQLVEIIGSVKLTIAPVATKPANIFPDGLHVFRVFLGGIRIIEAQIAESVELFRHAEVQADGLGMPEVKVAVRFGWKPRMHFPIETARGIICHNLCADKIRAFLNFRFLRLWHFPTPWFTKFLGNYFILRH